MKFDSNIDYDFSNRRDVDFSFDEGNIEDLELSNLNWHLDFEAEIERESLEDDFYDEFNEGPKIIGSFVSFMFQKSFELIKK